MHRGRPEGAGAAANAEAQGLPAQVAVVPLSEICFPHYVLLQENQLDACVRQFGAVIMKLVGQALGKV